mgnify:CR=1 FL=1
MVQKQSRSENKCLNAVFLNLEGSIREEKAETRNSKYFAKWGGKKKKVEKKNYRKKKVMIYQNCKNTRRTLQNTYLLWKT